MNLFFMLFQVQLMKLRELLQVRSFPYLRRKEISIFMFLFSNLYIFFQSTLPTQWEKFRSAYANKIKENGQVLVNHWNFTILFYLKKTEVRPNIQHIYIHSKISVNGKGKFSDKPNQSRVWFRSPFFCPWFRPCFKIYTYKFFLSGSNPKVRISRSISYV